MGNWLDSQKEIDEIKWNKNLEKLENVKKELGRFPRDDEPCNKWLNHQRQKKREGNLSKEREEKLDALGNWFDSQRKLNEMKWNEKLKELENVKKELGRFPKGDEPCSRWLIRQRQDKREERISKEREAKLDALGDWMTPVGREKVKSIKRNEEEIKIKKPRT